MATRSLRASELWNPGSGHRQLQLLGQEGGAEQWDKLRCRFPEPVSRSSGAATGGDMQLALQEPLLHPEHCHPQPCVQAQGQVEAQAEPPHRQPGFLPREGLGGVKAKGTWLHPCSSHEGSSWLRSGHPAAGPRYQQAKPQPSRWKRPEGCRVPRITWLFSYTTILETIRVSFHVLEPSDSPGYERNSSQACVFNYGLKRERS